MSGFSFGRLFSSEDYFRFCHATAPDGARAAAQHTHDESLEHFQIGVDDRFGTSAGGDRETN
jgi:hypothetical protein